MSFPGQVAFSRSPPPPGPSVAREELADPTPTPPSLLRPGQRLGQPHSLAPQPFHPQSPDPPIRDRDRGAVGRPGQQAQVSPLHADPGNLCFLESSKGLRVSTLKGRPQGRHRRHELGRQVLFHPFPSPWPPQAGRDRCAGVWSLWGPAWADPTRFTFSAGRCGHQRAGAGGAWEGAADPCP